MLTEVKFEQHIKAYLQIAVTVFPIVINFNDDMYENGEHIP